MHAKGTSDAFSSPLAALNFTLDVADSEGSKSVREDRAGRLGDTPLFFSY